MFSRVFLISLLPSVLSLIQPRDIDESFGQRPLMGWNPYNAAGCTINQTYATTMLERFVDIGFPGAGYKHYSVDCGWVDYERDAQTGGITFEAAKWPNGMKAFGELVKSKKLSFGLYTGMGLQQCDTIMPGPRPGSLHHEEVDAEALRRFGADYVKIDNCYVQRNINAPKSPRTDFIDRYSKMHKALQQAGIDNSIICQWGLARQLPNGTLQAPGEWTPQYGQHYRLSDDIATGWFNTARILNQAIHIADRNLTGPGRFADADLLEVGNAQMTTDEQATHFAFWALFKSPLFVSTDLTKLTDESKSILFNKQLIEANQDLLGKPIKLVQRWSGERDLFAGPLSQKNMAVLMIEQGDKAANLTIDFADLGISSADVLDMWSNETQTAVRSYSKTVQAHGSIALKLSNVKKAPQQPVKYNHYEFADAKLGGGAQYIDCTQCPGLLRAGYIGNGDNVTVTGVKTSKRESTVLIDYSNAEIAFLGSTTPNVRGASVSVNGGEAQLVQFPLSGYSFDDPKRGYKVFLTGFDSERSNNVTFSLAPSISTNAPEFSRLSVEM